MSPYDWSYMQKTKKQTPIPEKIEISTDPFDDTDHKKDEIINSLIDILTEQQKEIEALKQYRNSHIDWHRDNNPKPYTAMRSTGELTKEELKKMQIEVNRMKDEYEDIKPAPGAFIPNFTRTDIKPQEDKIKEKLKEYFTNHLGLDRNLDEIAGRILAIVKGE